MSLLGGMLMVLAGLAILSFGLFLFYAWLPLLYGLDRPRDRPAVGQMADGHRLSYCHHPWNWRCGTSRVVILRLSSHIDALLLGISGGVLILIGLSIAALFGLDGWLGGFFGLVLAAVCGVIGGIIVPYFFNAFIVAASAVGGASMVMAGTHLILPNVGLFDHAGGGLLPRLLALLLAVVGMGWQLSNIAKWVQSQPLPGDVAGRR